MKIFIHEISDLGTEVHFTDQDKWALDAICSADERAEGHPPVSTPRPLQGDLTLRQVDGVVVVTGHVDTDKLEKVLMEVMNLTPRGIREHLQLNKPIYARTSAFGHFGREPDAEGGFSWEKTDLVDKLKAAVR